MTSSTWMECPVAYSATGKGSLLCFDALIPKGHLVSPIYEAKLLIEVFIHSNLINYKSTAGAQKLLILGPYCITSITLGWKSVIFRPLQENFLLGSITKLLLYSQREH